MEQPYPLVWTSPLDLSAPAVFDVVVAKLERDTAEGWDVEEKYRGYRYFLLTLRCLPFARAVESTILEALPVPADPAVEDRDVIDDCTATTGWSIETSGSSPSGPSLDGASALAVTATIDSASRYLRLVRTGAFVVPVDYYLSIDVDWSHTPAAGGPAHPLYRMDGAWGARINEVFHSPIAITYDGESGSTRLFFDTTGAITDLAVYIDYLYVGDPEDSTIVVHNVSTTDTLGASTTTTNRQQSRLVTVEGSAPTQAAVRFYDANPADLGTDILVYTTRNTDWRPNLRRWLTSSVAPTADATLISGAKHDLGSATVFNIPAYLFTLGTYALMANVDVASDTTLSWTAQIATSGGATNIVGSSVTLSGSVDLAATTGFEVVNLATNGLILPTVETESETFTIELTLTASANVTLDEAWLFSLDDGALTWIKDTETMDWIEVRSPELGAARPSVWGGRGSSGSNGVCVDWKCESFGPHRFEPGTMQIFTVASTSLETQAEIEFFPRGGWHVTASEAA
jgi:hypothetical protein